MSDHLVLHFGEIGKESFPLVGGKGLNLGLMAGHGIPIPPGFVVTTNAFRAVLNANAGRTAEVRQLISSLDPENIPLLQEVSARIRELIESMEVPGPIQLAIHEAYLALGDGLVAVRSSATAEDLPEMSFAGQQATFLNVHGVDSVILHTLRCMASLFTERAIAYRAMNGIDHLDVYIAVVIQRMVQAAAAGVSMTVDAVTMNRGQSRIDAAYGLGEFVVSGEVTPDTYIVDRELLTILSAKISRQQKMLVLNPGGNGNVVELVREELQDQPKITAEHVIQIAKLGLLIERQYGGKPQDVEWALDYTGELFITQSRPITTLTNAPSVELEAPPNETAQLLLTGIAASRGVTVGKVQKLRSSAENHLIQPDSDMVLVAESTAPDFLPAMHNALAFLTGQGGPNSHAAIVGRENGITAVVGATGAMELEDGLLITVDGFHGKVYLGVAQATLDWYDRYKVRLAAEQARVRDLKTETKLYAIIANPKKAGEVAKQGVDGFGLVRIEEAIAEHGIHPLQHIADGTEEQFISMLVDTLIPFCKATSGPVIVRCWDVKRNEILGLVGTSTYEPVRVVFDADGATILQSTEDNPMMGWRGVRRYIEDPKSFRLECEALRRVRAIYPNLWVMLPFVRTVSELQEVMALMADFGLRREDGVKIGMMVEVPSNVFMAEEFAQLVDFFSIGSNDLTQLILGADRDNGGLAPFYTELDPAVLKAIQHVIQVANTYGIPVGICGQGPSNHPSLARLLVEWGITSVGVTPDVLARTRGIIAEVEGTLHAITA